MEIHFKQLWSLLTILLIGLSPGLVGALTPANGYEASSTSTQASFAAASSIPRYDHVVIVMEENTSESTIIGNTANAPYINTLANNGVSFTDSHAVTHPSQPNYVALFSGSTQGLTSDACPHTFSVNNLGNQLRVAGFSFTGYSETMPSNGYTGCTSGNYARKHAPWVNFSDLPASTNLTYASFPTDFTTLPTVSFVIPNLCDDMHDCSTLTGDTWLKNNLDAYAQWARSHNSLLIVTWDEDDSTTSANQIATIFYGAGLKNGSYPETINHYNVLRTLEDMYGLTALGSAASATPITDVWGAAVPDFSVSSSPAALSFAQGGVGTDSVTVTSTNGFNASVSFSISGLPSGVSASFSPASVIPVANGSATSTLTLTASSAAATGSATATVTATSGTVTHTSTVTLTVTPAPDFGLGDAPATLNLALGASNSDTVTVTSLNGFNSAVNLSVSGLPIGVTASFGNASVTPAANGSATSALSLSATSSANLGTSTITVTGKSGSITHTSTFLLTVIQPDNPDFSIAPSSTSLSITQGATATDVFTVNSISGFSSAVSFVASGLPAGVTASFSPASLPAANGNTTLTLTASATAATGQVTVTIVGTSMAIVHTAAITLTINPASGNTLQNGVPVTGLSGAKGGQLSYTVAVPAGASNLVIATSGGSGDEDMYVKFGSAPTLSSYDCRPYVSGNSESCTFATPQVGTYYILLNGYAAFSGVSLTASWNVSAPDFNVAVAPASLTITQGANATDAVTVASIGGFSSAVNWSVSGLPAGVTAAFLPSASTPAANGAASSILTLTASSTATMSTLPITVTGTAGAVTHSATIALTVNAAVGGSTQLLGNTGFESTASWTATSGVICATGCSGESAHAGSGLAWMDGYGSAHTDTLSQSVAIPGGKTAAVLQYYLHIDTAETTTSTASDTLSVQILNASGAVLATLATYSNLNAATGYVVHTHNLNAYLGQTVTIKFTGTENASNQTSFALDDITLTAQ